MRNWIPRHLRKVRHHPAEGSDVPLDDGPARVAAPVDPGEPGTSGSGIGSLPVAELLERSSLGEPRIRRLNENVSDEVAAEILARAASPARPFAFLGYRNKKERQVARLLREALERRFGPGTALQGSMESLLLDDRGRDVDPTTRVALSRCDVLLVVTAPAHEYHPDTRDPAYHPLSLDVATALRPAAQVILLVLNDDAPFLTTEPEGLTPPTATMRLGRRTVSTDLQRLFTALADTADHLPAPGTDASGIEADLIHELRATIGTVIGRGCRENLRASIHLLRSAIVAARECSGRLRDQGTVARVERVLRGPRDEPGRWSALGSSLKARAARTRW